MMPSTLSLHPEHAASTASSSAVPSARRWRFRSLLLILVPWLALQIGGLFSPGLLDDVDSVYLEIAREMLVRHDFVTPTVDGVRFFDKPPLMYWMAAGSMRLFGMYDWAARLPLALGVLLLLVAVYALGIRLFAASSPPDAPDRGGLYAALATGVSIGPYLYTRFYIPDILVALWMTLAVHGLLLALDRVRSRRSAFWPMAGFAIATALNVLTKGLIGLVFPLGFAFLYLLWTQQLRALRRLPLASAASLFLAIAAPWHILAALRNPAVPMPADAGLPARAGWAWFYLYNEHVGRFLQRRIPHDYGQVPVPLFWLLLLLWLLPWTGFLPAAIAEAIRDLRRSSQPQTGHSLSVGQVVLCSQKAVLDSCEAVSTSCEAVSLSCEAAPSPGEGPRALFVWAGLVLSFFTLSSRQEYYHLPALPALALLVGGMLSMADQIAYRRQGAQALSASRWFLVPLGFALFLLCGYFALTAPRPEPGATLHALLSSNPALYNLSLGHIFDLTGRAMGLFRGPLATVALGMLFVGPGSHLVRRAGHSFAANLLLTAAMTVVLLGAHEGLVRFYPILGSKNLAKAVNAARKPGDRIAVDGELTSGSTLLFYTQQPLLLVNGRINGPWFGSFWPDAPPIFLSNADLYRLWAGPQRVFLLTCHATKRKQDLQPLGTVAVLAESGGKTILTNR